MAESKLNRLYSEDPVTGFGGNILKPEHINEMVDSLLLMNILSLDFSGNTIDFKNGVTLSILEKDKEGNALKVKITTKFKTDKTPFTQRQMSPDYYINKDIDNVDPFSDFVVLKPNGTTYSREFYSINSLGVISFIAPQSDLFVYVSNLTVIKEKTIVLNRAEDTSIIGYTVL
jgi:hypothetical protein